MSFRTRMLKKSGVYLAFILGSTLAAALYGIVHDQISYTLSPEYYTHFKFQQFGLPWGNEHPRTAAAVVGMLATWWVGTGCAILLGLLGFIYREPRQMLRQLIRSACWVFGCAIVGGIGGYLLGCQKVTPETIATYGRWLSPNITDPIAFVRVGFLHNGSYLGGFIGLIGGSIQLLIVRILTRKRPPLPLTPDTKR